MTIEVIFGLLAPFVISLLKNPQWSDSAKIALTVIVSVALATGSEFIAGGFVWDVPLLLTKASVIFSTATVFYKTLIAHTQINTTLEKAFTTPE